MYVSSPSEAKVTTHHTYPFLSPPLSFLLGDSLPLSSSLSHVASTSSLNVPIDDLSHVSRHASAVSKRSTRAPAGLF